MSNFKNKFRLSFNVIIFDNDSQRIITLTEVPVIKKWYQDRIAPVGPNCD